jgi:xanthine dehydrogenase YagS FAD-binding subunit
LESVLEPGELIEAILTPSSSVHRRSSYVKVRDRASFEFAVVSAAVALDLDGGRIQEARVALGGVGTRPWRVPQVEAALAGRALEPPVLWEAASLSTQGARGFGGNDFKIELAPRAIVRAIETAGGQA